jgi:manganese oxidase
MAGMFPTMVAIMMGRDMRAMDPRELLYWGTMSLAIGVGFLTAYPVNWWLVSKGLKHGLMTVRPVTGHGDSASGHDGRDAAETSRPQPAAAHAHSAHMHAGGV